MVLIISASLRGVRNQGRGAGSRGRVYFFHPFWYP